MFESQFTAKLGITASLIRANLVQGGASWQALNVLCWPKGERPVRRAQGGITAVRAASVPDQPPSFASQASNSRLCGNLPFAHREAAWQQRAPMVDRFARMERAQKQSRSSDDHEQLQSMISVGMEPHYPFHRLPSTMPAPEHAGPFASQFLEFSAASVLRIRILLSGLIRLNFLSCIRA